MSTAIPHERIREDEDRSFTFVLLARLAEADLPEEEREEIATTLERLDDPRAEPHLLRLLQDHAAPVPVRGAASTVLRSSGAENRFQLPTMLRDGDPIVQRYAILGMTRGHADLLEPIARDPGHRFHREGIHAMRWGFEEPRFQALKIAALSHPDPSVRETAADVLLWDEPTAAEEPLLAALADREERVVLAAVNALQYYPTRRTLTHLAELAEREGKPGEDAGDSFDELRSSFMRALQYAEGSKREELLAWMQPVWSILAFTDDELLPEVPIAFERAKPAQDIVTADELLELLSDPGGPWAEKKRRLDRADPAAFSTDAIARLTPFLATHPDPAVRSGGARLLAAWNQHDALLALLEDPRYYVMKMAMYHLGKTVPSQRVAERALCHFLDPGVTSTHIHETLDTYVAHAPAAEAIPRLRDLAAREERETVRVDAIRALTELGAAREVEPLLSLLEAPPLMTWSVHMALLEAARKLDLAPRGLDALRAVDNLDLCRNISMAGARR